MTLVNSMLLTTPTPWPEKAYNLAKNHHHEGPSCGCHDAVMT
jgi:hypothetical protein